MARSKTLQQFKIKTERVILDLKFGYMVTQRGFPAEEKRIVYANQESVLGLRLQLESRTTVFPMMLIA